MEAQQQPLVLGRYVLHDKIASGGMATVHLGRLVGPVGFARVVAIKRLHGQLAEDPEFVSMFLDEARLSARIHHPNVVPVIDVVAMSGELLLVMEYVRGESLARLVRGERQVPAPIATSIITGVLHGLHAAHEAVDERGDPLCLVHRDVSPQNILVGVDGIARVVDFGVAKAVGRVQTTREGQLKGKLAYMAPEQLRGEATRATDVYAAAVVLWELLTGRRLFAGSTEAETLAKVFDQQLEPPARYVPTLPPALNQIVLRALSSDPKKRFATAKHLASALESVVSPASTSQVGAWVEATAEEALSRRASLVAKIEGSSRSAVTASLRPPAPPSATDVAMVSLADRPDEATLTQLSSNAGAGSVTRPRARTSLLVAVGALLLAAVVAGVFVAAFSVAPAGSTQRMRAAAGSLPKVRPAAPPIATASEAEPTAPAAPPSSTPPPTVKKKPSVGTPPGPGPDASPYTRM